MVGLCDFHIHSTYSDGTLTLSQIVDEYGRRGFKAISITDHLCEEKTILGFSAKLLSKTLTRRSFKNYVDEIRQEAKRALKQYGMFVIPGIEITKNTFSHNNSSHILALNVCEYINPDQSIEEISYQIRSLGGAVIAAHPVNTKKIEHQTLHLWANRGDLSKYFDAWEVATGVRYFTEVEQSGLPIIANSDLHHKSQIESWKTLVNDSKTISKIISSIKSQNLDVIYYGSNNISLKNTFLGFGQTEDLGIDE